MESRQKALAHFRKSKRTGRDELEMPMKKVSVMADSEEGLEKGLKKAQELVEDPEIIKDMMEGEEEEYEEEMPHEYSDEKLESMSREELMECVKKMRDQE